MTTFGETGRTLDLADRADLGYLRGVVDTAGSLSDRTDMAVAPLSAFWRNAILALIDVADRAASSSGESR